QGKIGFLSILCGTTERTGTMKRRLYWNSSSREFRRPLRQIETRGISVVLTTKTGLFPPENGERIRCVIADDHELVRYGVRRLLEDSPDFVVVAEAGDAADALKLTLKHRPDLVLLDIGMPGMSSFEACRLIEEHCPESRIVYLTMHEDKEYVQQALRSGASGYLLKDTPTPILLRALLEPTNPAPAKGRRAQTRWCCPSTAAQELPDLAGARSDEAARRGPDRAAGGYGTRHQHQDSRGTQVQPDAQTRHPQ